MDRNNVEEVLLILQEECAEVIHISNKALRFGLEDIHPVTNIKNRAALVQEIGDVMAMVDLLISMKIITDDELQTAKNNKIEKLKVWSFVFTRPAHD